MAFLKKLHMPKRRKSSITQAPVSKHKVLPAPLGPACTDVAPAQHLVVKTRRGGSVVILLPRCPSEDQLRQRAASHMRQASSSAL